MRATGSRKAEEAPKALQPDENRVLRLRGLRVAGVLRLQGLRVSETIPSATPALASMIATSPHEAATLKRLEKTFWHI